MTSRLGWALAAVLVAMPAAAFDIEGKYRLSRDADCSAEGATLRIANGIFYGTESQCRMENPVQVRDMKANLYDMTCAGEGSSWVERAMFMEAAEGGLVIVWNGYAFQYERCPAQ